MAKYLSYGGLEKVWGLAKNYFPTVKTATVNGTEVTWTTNTGVSAGNVATFAVDANGLVSLTGITTSSLASSHTHALSIAADSGTSALAMAANTKYKLTAGGSTFIFTTPPNPSIGNAALKLASDSGTATQAFTANSSTASTITVKGDGTYISGAVSGSSNAPIVTLSHATQSGVTASTNYGPTAAVTGTNNTTIKVPHLKVDAAGHVIELGEYTYTSKDTTYSNNVSHSSAAVTAGTIPVWNAAAGASAAAVLKDGYTVDTTTMSSSDSAIPTSAAVADYVSDSLGSLTGALVYKGTIASSGGTVTALPASHAVGDVYVVATAGTYAGKVCEVGDMVICNKAGTTAVDSDWTVVNGENQVSQSNSEFTTDAASKAFAVVDGTTLNLKVTHHTPSGGSAMSTTAGNAVAWSGAVITGLTSDGKGHITGVTTGTIPANPTGNGRMTISANGGTAVNTLYTANVNSATNAINFVQGTGITTAVTAYSSSTPAKVTITHADPGTGTDLAATNTDTTTYTNGGEYTVVTGVTVTKDSLGHVTGLKETRQTIKSSIATPASPGAGVLQVVANSGTSGVATPFTANVGSNTIGLNFINGTHTTAVVTAVSGKAPTITFNHNSAGTGTDLAATNTDTTTYTNGSTYDVVTGVTITKDSLGHVTGIKETRQRIKSDGGQTSNVTTAAFVASSTSATSATAAGTTIANGSLYYVLREGSTNTATLITGSGGTTVTKDGNGINRIIITSPEVVEITEAEINTVCVI